MVRCDCKAPQDVSVFQENMGTPLIDVDVEDLSVRGPGTRKMIDATRKFVDDPVGMLTIYGNNGTGKTTVLMGIIRAMLSQSVQAVYMTASDLLSYLKDGFGMDYDDRARLDKIGRVQVLAIDEFQMVNWSNEWTEQVVTDLLNRRCAANQRGSTFGTVMAQDQGLDVLPYRIESRMKSGVIVRNDDPDFRDRDYQWRQNNDR